MFPDWMFAAAHASFKVHREQRLTSGAKVYLDSRACSYAGR